MNEWESVNLDFGIRRFAVPGGWLYETNHATVFVPAQLGRDIGGLAFHRKVRVCLVTHTDARALEVNNTRALVLAGDNCWPAMPLEALIKTSLLVEEKLLAERIAYWEKNTEEVDCLGMVIITVSNGPHPHLVCVLRDRICLVPPGVAQVVP